MFLKVILWKIKQIYGNWRTQYKYYQDAIQDEFQEPDYRTALQKVSDDIKKYVPIEDLPLLSDKEVEEKVLGTCGSYIATKDKKGAVRIYKEKAQPKKARKGTR